MSSKTRYFQLIAAGLCGICGDRPLITESLCDICRVQKLAAKSLLRTTRLTAGLCGDCGKRPLHTVSRCQLCCEREYECQKTKRWDEFLAVLDAYGGRCCVYCGESELPFLVIDHILNDGHEDRRTNGGKSGYKLYARLRKMGYPAGYQTLCSSCNTAKSRNCGLMVTNESTYHCGCTLPSRSKAICSHGFTTDQLRYRKLVIDALIAYGGVCICCGETSVFKLVFDHSRNDGSSHRQIAGVHMAKWLRRRDYPRDLGIEILCANCNDGRERNGGVCPHIRS
jgi:hypothetical protein